jgi:hypothetical protein
MAKIQKLSQTITFNEHISKWNDNMQENGNIMDFHVNGDTASGGRFNFLYRE